MSLAKQKRIRCQRFLDWLKGWPCIVTSCKNLGTDPHHVKTVGAGGSDFTALPLCRECHSKFHNCGADTFEKSFVPEGFHIFQVRYLSAFLEFISSEVSEVTRPENEIFEQTLASRRFIYRATGDTKSFRKILSDLGWFYSSGQWLEDSGIQPWDQRITAVTRLPGVKVFWEVEIG